MRYDTRNIDRLGKKVKDPTTGQVLTEIDVILDDGTLVEVKSGKLKRGKLSQQLKRQSDAYPSQTIELYIKEEYYDSYKKWACDLKRAEEGINPINVKVIPSTRSDL